MPAQIDRMFPAIQNLLKLMVHIQIRYLLPSSLRDAIVRRGMALLARMRREKEVTAEIKPDGSGYQVICSLHEGSLTFFSMAFYAPDRVQADIIAGNFRKKAPELYQGLIHALTE